MKIPSGINVKIENDVISVSGPKGTSQRKFDSNVLKVNVASDEITVVPVAKKITRKINASSKAIEAHLKNMFNGVSTGFSKKLVVVYSHFPVTIESKGDQLFVKNYMGEKSARIAKIVTGTSVNVGKGEITVSGCDAESVGQTAANIIAATNLTKRDRRVFQDGIYHAIE